MQSIRQAAGIKLPEPDMPNIKVEKEGLIAKLKSFFKSMLSDSHDDNAVSSKRFIAFLAFICCMIAFFIDLFTNYQITPTLFDSMMWIVIAGFGFSGLEKFAPKE